MILLPQLYNIEEEEEMEKKEEIGENCDSGVENCFNNNDDNDKYCEEEWTLVVSRRNKRRFYQNEQKKKFQRNGELFERMNSYFEKIFVRTYVKNIQLVLSNNTLKKMMANTIPQQISYRRGNIQWTQNAIDQFILFFRRNKKYPPLFFYSFERTFIKNFQHLTPISRVIFNDLCDWYDLKNDGILKETNWRFILKNWEEYNTFWQIPLKFILINDINRQIVEMEEDDNDSNI